MGSLRRIIFSAAEIGFAFVALLSVIYLLLGAETDGYISSVIANVGTLVQAVSPEAIVSVAVIYGLTCWFRKKNAG
jgi:hypothetical protein